jgi:hypothetical protein
MHREMKYGQIRWLHPRLRETGRAWISSESTRMVPGESRRYGHQEMTMGVAELAIYSDVRAGDAVIGAMLFR